MTNQEKEIQALKAVLAAAREVVNDHEVIRKNHSSVNRLAQTMDAHAEGLDLFDWKEPHG